MGSGGQVDLSSSSAAGPLRQSLDNNRWSDTQIIHNLIRDNSSFSTSSSSTPSGSFKISSKYCKSQHQQRNGVVRQLIPAHSIEIVIQRIQRCYCFPQTMRTQLLTVLMSGLLILMVYCSLGGSASSPILPDYNLYLVEHPHRIDPPRNTSQHFPQAIIIGVRKGGTRALLEFLSLHSQIVKAEHEMHFFDKPEQFEKGLEWYRKEMPYTYATQLTIEKTPSYFITPETPMRIREMNPNTKILLIVRDPVIRVLSDYTQILSSRMSQNLPCKSFEDLVTDPLTGSINLGYKAIQISIYHHHYRRWKATFPPTQIHVIDGDKLITNPINELAKVESFLGIRHALTPGHFYFNKTKGFYCMKRNATSERCLGPSKGRTHPAVDSKVMQKLRDFYSPHNEIFFNMTGRWFDWAR